jgi:alkylation response protein AidB-like acyl-CoA dehydrogenase
VPSKHVVNFSPEGRQESGPLYLFSNSGIFGPAFGSVALGIAHTALCDIIDFAAGKVPRGMERSIRENSSVQAAVATAQARLGAARA